MQRWFYQIQRCKMQGICYEIKDKMQCRCNEIQRCKMKCIRYEIKTWNATQIQWNTKMLNAMFCYEIKRHEMHDRCNQIQRCKLITGVNK